MSIKFDKIMGDIREKDGDDCLKLDQTTPQTVENGMPEFKGGIAVPITGVSSYFVSNSPVKYNGNDCFVAANPEDPEDTGLGCLWYVEEYLVFYDDDGTTALAECVGLDGATTPTINLDILGANFGTEEEPYWIYLTGYSDLNLADFAAWANALFGMEGALVGIHTEVAFTYNSETGEYDKITTLPLASPSPTTTWPALQIEQISGGFIVSPISSDVRHNGNYSHYGNYTNTDETKILRHRGQIKVGDGNYADYITAPLVCNPMYDDVGSGALRFAMTFVPEIQRIGAEGSPISASLYVAGMYGTTVMEGAYVNYSGTVMGGWAAIQNAIFAPQNVTLTEGVAMRAGMTYSTDGQARNLPIAAFACFQSAFTNLNGGTSSHTTVKHFETGNMGDKATAVTNYGIYIIDNSAHATTSYGVYSLEHNNYVKGLYVGSTPTVPTEDLEVQANIKAAGYKTGTETGQTTTVTVVTDTRMNSGQLEKKTQVLTYTAGLLTAKGAESEWTATTDI